MNVLSAASKAVNQAINYYQLLHVQPDAPVAVIKASYRTMMQKLKYHPDLGGDAGAAQQLNEAVATLCDPLKRQQYDLQLMQATEATRDNQAESGSPGTTGTASAAPDSPMRQQPDQERPKTESHAGDEEVTSKTPGRPTATAATFPARAQCAFCHAAIAPASSHSQPYDSTRCSRCSGAVTPVRQIEKSCTDQLRKIYRHDHKASVVVWQEWPLHRPLEGELNDLSPAGCAILSTQPMQPGKVVLLDTDALNAVCTVRYCKPSTEGLSHDIGLEFLTLKIKAQPGSVFSITA